MNSFPPHAPEAERAVLSCLIGDQAQLASALETLTDDCFVAPNHRLLFQVLKELHASGGEFDLDQIRRRLVLIGLPDDVAMQLTVETSAFVFVPVSGPFYQSILLDSRDRRRDLE